MTALRRWAPAMIKMLLAATMVFFVVRSVPLKAADFSSFLLTASPRFYASLIVFAAFLMLQAGIWVLIVNAAAGRSAAGTPAFRLGMLQGLRIFIDSQFAKYIPGGIWNYAGRVVLATRAGVPMDAQLASIVYENVLLFSAALVYALVLAVGTNFEPVPLIGIAILVTLLAYLYYPKAANGARRLFASASRWKPVRRLIAKATGASASGGSASGATLTRNQFFGFLGCFLVSHFIMGIAFWMLVGSFGSGQISLWFAAGTFATSWLLGLLSPLPGGLGVREGFLVYFLSLQLDYGTALHVSVIARVWNIMAEVAFWAVIRTASQLRRKGEAQ